MFLLLTVPPSLPLSSNHKELKLKYYHLMIDMCHHTEEFLQISKHYHSVYETSSVQKDEARRKEVGTIVVNWRQCRSPSSADSFVDVLLARERYPDDEVSTFQGYAHNTLQVDGLHYHM